MRENNRGSLLIELLLGLALVGIILGIVGFNTEAIYKYKLDKEVKELKKDVDKLRIDSLKRSTNSQFIIDGDSTYKLKIKDKNSTSAYTYKVKEIETFTISSNVKVYEFNRNGSPKKANTILLNHKYGIWELTISPVTGKTNLKK